PERTLRHTPLFQVMLVQHEAAPAPMFADLRATPIAIDSGTATFDLTLTVLTTEDRFELDCEYDTDQFDRATVDGWLAAFEAVLDDAMRDRGRRIDQLRLAEPAVPVTARAALLDRRL